MDPNYVIFVIGIMIFLFYPRFVPLYYLLWNTMFAFILDIIIPVSYEEYSLGHSISMYYIWLCALISIPMRHKMICRCDRLILLFLISFLFYIISLGLSRGTSLSILFWIIDFFCFVPLWILMKQKNIKFRTYSSYIVFAIIIEVLIVAFQFATGYYPSFTGGAIAENGATNVVGTLVRFNEFADNVSLLLLSLIFIRRYDKSSISSIFYYFSLISCFILVYIAGARTELVAIILALVLYLYFGNPQIRKKMIIVSICGVAILCLAYTTFSDSITIGSEENSARQQELLDFALGDVDVSEGSTLSFSAVVLAEYFSDKKNILTGSGKLFASPNGYSGIVTESEFRWDCFDALFVAETGLIGVLFLFIILYLIIKQSTDKIMPTILVIYLLTVSLTDYGLFQGNSAIYFLFVAYYCNSVKMHKSYALKV